MATIQNSGLQVSRDFFYNATFTNSQLQIPVGDVSIYNPNPAGKLMYNTVNNAIYYSDGLQWLLISGGGGLPNGLLGTPNVTINAPAGDVITNAVNEDTNLSGDYALDATTVGITANDIDITGTLALNPIPDLDNTLTDILVRDPITGEIKRKNLSSGAGTIRIASDYTETTVNGGTGPLIINIPISGASAEDNYKLTIFGTSINLNAGATSNGISLEIDSVIQFQLDVPISSVVSVAWVAEINIYLPSINSQKNTGQMSLSGAIANRYSESSADFSTPKNITFRLSVPGSLADPQMTYEGYYLTRTN